VGAGYTNRGEHEFARVVIRGFRWLRQQQDREGWIRVGTPALFAWDHALATLALVEMYGMTQSPLWKQPARDALAALQSLRQRGGAWRYGLRQDVADLSLTFWAMLSIQSARLVNEDAARRERTPPFVLDEDVSAGVRAWLEEVTDPESGAARGPRAGEDTALPGESTAAMSAMAALLRLFARESLESTPLRLAVAAVVAAAPIKDAESASIDVVQWWAGKLVTFQAGGEAWKVWEQELDEAVVSRQHMREDYCALRGSWDPMGPWALEGGRVVTTALLCMSLEVTYRCD
jgi:hypothetical protein